MDFLASLRKWTLLRRNCYVDGLSSLFMNTINQNAVITQTKRAKQNAKSLMTTKPIRNADFWAKTNGLCIFMRSQNLWDFALDKKK